MCYATRIGRTINAKGPCVERRTFSFDASTVWHRVGAIPVSERHSALEHIINIQVENNTKLCYLK